MNGPSGADDAGSVGLVRPYKLAIEQPLTLDCGRTLPRFDLMVETYGTLNAEHGNAVLVCHALSGDHHAAGFHAASDAKPGWWDRFIGPGKPIDTNRFHVVSINNLGGCNGSTGPNTPDPETGALYGPDFPLVTARDWVRSQALLADALGIERWAAVIGGSLGGMQVMQWAIDQPERLRHAVIIAAAPRLTAQNIAFNEIARQAIISDPDFHGGRYTEHGVKPARGLTLARMLGHITYLSDEAMRARFGRVLREAKDGGYAFNYDVEFEVESYLRHQGQSFVERFDANTYLLMTKALDYFDPARAYGDDLAAAFRKASARFLVIAFRGDWRFAPARSREIVDALVRARRDVTYAEIDSRRGHDDFLMPIPDYERCLGNYLQRVADELPSATGESRAATGGHDHGGDIAVEQPPAILRPDLARICNWITPGSRILDLGCGEGELLAALAAQRQVGGYGLEIEAANVSACIEADVNVIQADLNQGLAGFEDDSFDTVVMTQALQALARPDLALEEMLRVGRQAIVTFPNFGHWRARLALAQGRMPETPALPHRWYDSPNIHLCTVQDFETLCERHGWRIRRRALLDHNRSEGLSRLLPNLLCEVALYQLERNGPTNRRAE